jgi:acyl-CoA reductase-like NAD-dependent aldehyde dehydrogenase
MINNEQSLLYINGKFRPAKSGKTYPNIAPATGGTIGTAADTPFAGYKQSGIGREMGREGFEEYLETKSVAVPA